MSLSEVEYLILLVKFALINDSGSVPLKLDVCSNSVGYQGVFAITELYTGTVGSI